MVDIPEVPSGLSENLIEIEGDIFRVVKDGRKKRLVPVRVRANLNPLNVAAAGIAALGGMLAATIAWHGVSVPGPLGGQFTLFKGLKETTLGADINAWYEKRKTKQQLLDAGVDPRLLSEDPCVLSQALHGAEGNAVFRAAIREDAKKKGCAWAQ